MSKQSNKSTMQACKPCFFMSLILFLGCVIKFVETQMTGNNIILSTPIVTDEPWLI
jgi:hypothetical protein